MIFFFGWGRTTNKTVATTTNPCQKCTRGQTFDLVHQRVWFTLFFIPVIPYEHRYWFICRDCKCGYKLSEREFQDVKMRIQFGGGIGTLDNTTTRLP